VVGAINLTHHPAPDGGQLTLLLEDSTPRNHSAERGSCDLPCALSSSS